MFATTQNQQQSNTIEDRLDKQEQILTGIETALEEGFSAPRVSKVLMWGLCLSGLALGVTVLFGLWVGLRDSESLTVTQVVLFSVSVLAELAVAGMFGLLVDRNRYWR